MFEGLMRLVALERLPQDLARDWFDILIVAFITYRALLVLRGTRAMQIVIAFVAFGGLYFVAKVAELVTLMKVLTWLASSAILVVVVVFQNDIRRALIRVGSKAWLTRGRDAEARVITEVAAAATELARHRMGAIIALERDANVMEFVNAEGIELEAHVTRELLVSLFVPEGVNKTHDGAVLIRDLRIHRAGVFFPMPESTKITDAALGSRHRAALGITEETDALVIAVSEERGAITLCVPNGVMIPNIDGTTLRQTLLQLMSGQEEETRSGWQRLVDWARRRPQHATAEEAEAGAASNATAAASAKTIATAKPGSTKPSSAKPGSTKPSSANKAATTKTSAAKAAGSKSTAKGGAAKTGTSTLKSSATGSSKAGKDDDDAKDASDTSGGFTKPKSTGAKPSGVTAAPDTSKDDAPSPPPGGGVEVKETKRSGGFRAITRPAPPDANATTHDPVVALKELTGTPPASRVSVPMPTTKSRIVDALPEDLAGASEPPPADSSSGVDEVDTAEGDDATPDDTDVSVPMKASELPALSSKSASKSGAHQAIESARGEDT